MTKEANEAVFLLTLNAVPTVQTDWWDDFCNSLLDNNFLEQKMIPKKSITVEGVVSETPHRMALKPFAFNIHNGKTIRLYHFAQNHMMSLDVTTFTKEKD